MILIEKWERHGEINGAKKTIKCSEKRRVSRGIAKRIEIAQRNTLNQSNATKCKNQEP